MSARVSARVLCGSQPLRQAAGTEKVSAAARLDGSRGVLVLSAACRNRQVALRLCGLTRLRLGRVERSSPRFTDFGRKSAGNGKGLRSRRRSQARKSLVVGGRRFGTWIAVGFHESTVEASLVLRKRTDQLGRSRGTTKRQRQLATKTAWEQHAPGQSNATSQSGLRRREPRSSSTRCRETCKASVGAEWHGCSSLTI